MNKNLNLVISNFYFQDTVRMKQLNDLFSVPEICLLSNVTEYFIQNNIPYYPEILCHDVMVSDFNLRLFLFFLFK